MRARLTSILILLAVCSLALPAVHARLSRDSHLDRVRKSSSLVREYGLTDLSLFMEARYTRHPSQADLFSAFQNHPGAMDSFPSGSFLAPPEHLLEDSREIH